ncbi:peptidoglycan-binding protein [Streptomyces sp. NBC_00859]|uniref:peptidoglycan-binding protein n=1 Tax=Streptomyces sp. NBC_00859 TaxID=2903682 RepID=UPI00386D184E|nr:peptidoglycan-binding protein [Streptomyces sp. NBC_00859]
MSHEEHEEFDPLRIRPYVRLPDPPPDPADDVVGAAYPTVPLAAVRVTEPGAGRGAEPDTVTGPGGTPEPPAGRRRPFTVIAGGVAAVAVLGGAAFAAGLFSPQGPPRDEALPDVVTSAPHIPAGPSAPPSASATPRSRTGTASTPTTPALPAPSATGTPSGGPSPTATSGQASATAPTPSRSPAPGSDGTAGARPPRSVAPPAAVLRQGDSGPDVVELQQRLTQLYLYRDPADGLFDQDVVEAVRTYQSWMGLKDDPPGVYGTRTRRALEATTRQP